MATPKRLAIALAAVALLVGGWLWLRNSPLVSVERVQISGVQGVDAGPVDAALRSAARRMSTLDFDDGALRAAVAPFRVVKSVSATTSFPHGVRIEVVERLPVAEVNAAGIHTAVAGDGTILGPTHPELPAAAHNQLPSIALAGFPGPPGGQVENATARAELRVLGAAPRVLLGWVAKVYMSPPAGEGLTVQMRNGVEIYFGDATRPHAKWLAAARVLADPHSAGATYVDVLAPERPAAGTSAAGGLRGTTATTGQVSASDPTSAALASALAEAVNGGGGLPTSAGALPTSVGSTGAASSEPSATGATATAPVGPTSAQTSEQSPSTSG
ncbi:MAG TPA: FtsQ-type POTRA domain-containing protein [Solirubrobacteraceae bacterium]|jgi:cell division protein FtsQ|nr:FtsQ-type POTRA domain-containing protein [Solirubrobacteraceae bacterium]